jgi:hypothetical protein
LSAQEELARVGGEDGLCETRLEVSWSEQAGGGAWPRVLFRRLIALVSCMYTYVCVYVYMQSYACIHTYICIYVCLYVCVYALVSYMYTHAHTYVSKLYAVGAVKEEELGSGDGARPRVRDGAAALALERL